MLIKYTGAGVRTACAVFVRSYVILEMYTMPIFYSFQVVYILQLCLYVDEFSLASEIICENDFKKLYISFRIIVILLLVNLLLLYAHV